MSESTQRLKQLIGDARQGRDILTTFYEFQRTYQEALDDGTSGVEAARRSALAAFVELGEFVGAMNYKWYRAGERLDIAKLAGEIADVLAFMLNVLLHMNVGGQEAHDAIIATMQKNLYRLEEGVNMTGVRS